MIAVLDIIGRLLVFCLNVCAVLKTERGSFVGPALFVLQSGL